jgi:hypothetical protein
MDHRNALFQTVFASVKNHSQIIAGWQPGLASLMTLFSLIDDFAG